MILCGMRENEWLFGKWEAHSMCQSSENEFAEKNHVE